VFHRKVRKWYILSLDYRKGFLELFLTSPFTFPTLLPHPTHRCQSYLWNQNIALKPFTTCWDRLIFSKDCKLKLLFLKVKYVNVCKEKPIISLLKLVGKLNFKNSIVVKHSYCSLGNANWLTNETILGEPTIKWLVWEQQAVEKGKLLPNFHVVM
jgi:hypothetical protein